MRSTSTSSTIFDAIVIGGGPSGLGASLALSGWRRSQTSHKILQPPKQFS